MTFPFSHGPLGDLAQLDQDLLDLLLKRRRLVEKAIKKTLNGPGRPAQVQVEKELWRLWQETGKRSRLDLQILRQIFSLIQELPAQAPSRKAEDRPFILSTRPWPVKVDIRGPADRVATRVYAVLAALSGQQMDLPGVLINDPLVDLIKSLNQVGAALYWEEDALKSRGGSPLSMAGKVIYAGENPFNMYLLSVLALAEPGWVKFTGGMDLKLLDLSSLSKFLPKLGARLVSLLPHSQGLPARIEASGILPDAIHLPATLQDEVVVALAAAAAVFRQGIRLQLPDTGRLRSTLWPTLNVLKSCAIDARLDDDGLTIPPGEPRIPERPSVELDPELSTGLLLLSHIAGGQVRLQGSANLESPQWETPMALLESTGLKPVVDGQALTTIKTNQPDRPGPLYTGQGPAYFPYYVVVAATQVLRSQTPAWLGADLPEAPIAAEFLQRLGLRLDEQDGRVKLESSGTSPVAQNEPWMSPDARWTLAYCLASFIKPGLPLANPGNLVQEYPGFWSLYNSLGRETKPKVEMHPKEEAHDEKRKPRRIRTSGSETSGD